MNKTIRIETNVGTCICFGIIALSISFITNTSIKERSKRSIEFKRIEEEIRQAHADMSARLYNKNNCGVDLELSEK